MIETTFRNDKHQVDITHTGTSGLTLTAAQGSDGLEVYMEVYLAHMGEMIPMVSELLEQLEARSSEALMAACLAYYATRTGKTIQISRGTPSKEANDA